MKIFKLNLKSIVQSNARGKKRKEKDERVLTMKEASVQHPFSIHSAPIAIRRQSGGNQEVRGNQEARSYAARVWKYAAMLLMVLTLGVGQMWAANEYNKRYLYVNSSNCSWWTNDDAHPCLDAYWSSSDFSDNQKDGSTGYKDEPDYYITSTSWCFDLSDGMSSSYLYYRGFKIQRRTSNAWNNAVTAGAENNGTHNCIWINSGGDGISWGNYAVPITSIALDASNNILSGTGASNDPYIVPVGKSVTLTATPSFTPADPTMQFCANFGTSPSSSPTTVQSSSTYEVSSTSKVELKCIGRNKYGDVYSADVTSSSVYVQGIEPVPGVAAAGSITTDAATLNATVTVNGATTTAYGFKYGTSSNRTTLISSGTTASTSGALAANATSFSKGVSSLTANTTYYYVSFVTTASETYYSASTQSFTTLDDAETTHEVTIYYKYNSTDIKSSTTLDVGEETPSNVSSASITGYTFSSWSLGDGLTNESGSTSADPISITTKASGTYTLTANYNINSYNVTFNAMSGSGSMSAESFNYNQTKALTTNTYTRDGYVFKGWATSSANATAGTVAYADGANYTMGSADVTLYAVWYKKAYFVNVPKWTAANVKAHVYKGDDAYKTWNSSDEVMTSTGTTVFGYTIYSYEFPDKYTTVKFHNAGANETDAWTWSSSTPYYYHGVTQYTSVAAIRQAWKIGGSWDVKNAAWVVHDFTSYDTDEATYTVTLAAATNYQFKFTFTSNDSWYGQTGTGNMSDGDTWTLNGSNTVNFTSTVAGTYTFTIDYSDISSNNAPNCTLDFPVSYTLTYAIGDVAGTAGSISSSPTTASGSKVLSGASVTLTAPSESTGYTWKGWYPNSDGTGVQQCSTKAYSITMSADVETYACYTENTYATTIQNDGHGTTTPSPSFNVSHHTGTSITANPSNYYAFDYWTIENGGLAFKSPYTASSNPTTVTATSTGGTIKAFFKDQWCVAGGNSGSSDGSDDMGDWSTNANPMTYTTGTSVNCTITINNPGTYYFKVKDRREDANNGWYGKNSTTITRASSSASGLNTDGANITFTADVAGTYVFTFDASANSISVKYPAKVTWSATSIYSGNSTTIAASVTGVTSGNSLKYELFSGTDMSVSPLASHTNTTSATTDSYSFTSVSPSFGESDSYKTYTVKITYDGLYAYYTYVVGRLWDIYVHDINSWGGVNLWMWNDEGSTGNFPGTACPVYNSPSTWYTVVLDGKYTSGFILSKTGDETTKTVDLATDISTYGHQTYWYINNSTGYRLTSAGTVVAPTVTLTVDKVNVNQITVTGTITDCGNDGTTAADMKEVGFKIGETSYVATYKSGTSFKKTITSLTANTDISVKAYATNIIGTGESAAKDTTTLADANYLVKVRVAHGATAPKVYAWTDADDYGGSKMENGTYKSQDAATLMFAATSYDWYSCELNNCYENFLIYTTGDSDKSGDFGATRTSDCYWYDASGSPQKANKMDCPRLTPHLAVKTSKVGADSYYEMDEDDGVASVEKTLTAGEYYIKVVYHTEYYGKGADYANTIARTGNTTSNAIEDIAVDGGYIVLTADFNGNYTFSFDESGEDLTVTYPTAYKVIYGQQTTGSGTAVTASASTTGDISSGDYVLPDEDITFSQAPATGYRLKGWFTTVDGETAVSGMDASDNVLDGIAADANVYAQYSENLCTVTINASNSAHGSITVAGEDFAWGSTTAVGVATTKALVVTPATGYYFSGWTLSSDPDFEVGGTGEAYASTTLSGIGSTNGSTGTLTANFVELEKIFFRNENETTGEKLWDVNKMYVYFNVGWANDGEQYGGVNNLGTNAEMNPVGEGSHIFWAYVPRTFTTSGNGKIAFSDKWMSNSAYPDGVWTKFYGGNGVYRTDYNTYLNMYVPACTKKYTSNSTNYFDNGYWMKYDTQTDQGASYYLKESTGSGQLSEFKIAAPNGTTIYTKYRFENTTAKTFYIANAAGTFYKAASNITSVACTDVNMQTGNTGFTVTPTSEGYYTFTIDQSGDTMKISVNYPISPGDYRLDYTHDTDKHLYSDIIKPDNASAITNVKKSVYVDPETTGVSLKLQKCTSLDAVTKQPNWTSGVSVGTLSTVFTNGQGVYEFDLAIDNTGKDDDEEVLSVALSNVKLYTGPYYIKTDYAPGGWVNFKQSTLEKNTITFDKADSKTFDYYFCKWVDGDGRNVKCIICNDYNEQITDTLINDAISNQYLSYQANVRFSYNSYTNELKRAYINGATDWQESFLLISADDGHIRSAYGSHSAFSGNDTTLLDQNNWIYMKDIEAREGARVKLTANYRYSDQDHIQYLIGEDGSGSYDDAYTKEILGGSNPDNWHKVRVIYDFKTNKLISAWLADGVEVDGTRAINTDVLVVRNGQEDATQITFATAASELTEVDTVYSALCLTKSWLTNGSNSDSERRFYWLAFPYEVRISDIFGSFGEYGETWIFQRYNGKKRAQYGFWAESSSNWEYITDKSTVLNAYEGYVLTLDLDEFASGKGVWNNDVTEIYEYFPSISEQSSIVYEETKTIKVDTVGYQCKIDRSKEVHNGVELGPEYDRRVRDSHWHLMGVPSYAQTSGNAFNDAESGWTSDKMPFFYSWNMSTNKLSAASTTTSDPFKPMKAYLVQYGQPTITWNAVSASPSAIVARRQTAEDIHFAEFNLHLMNGEESLDHTYVRLTDDEDASEDFEFGHDLCKEFQNGANIYTMIDQLQVAGNSLPLNTTGTTIVPVGVKIAANGEYIFSMPDGTNGIGVVLVDKVLNTRTNLSVFDYTVTLPAGTHNGRFVLEISPVHGSTTGMENSDVSSQNSDARKMIIDQKLFIIKGDKMYDARGAMVK